MRYLITALSFCVIASAAADDPACLKCHGPIRAKAEAKFKHAAVEAGCETCHVNHRQSATAEQRDNHFLLDKLPALCLTCHDAKDARLTAAHRNQAFAQAACTGCHDPHGSSAEKLLQPNQHLPFAGRECDTCHLAAQKGKITLVKSSVSETCYACHSDKKESIASAKFRHSLLQADENSCTDCHDPHAGKGQAFLKKTMPGLCTGCHVDITSAGKFVHEPAASCTFCHDPHAGPNAKSLHAPVNDLCLACHGPNAVAIVNGREPVKLFGGKVTLPPKAFEDLRWFQLSAADGKGHPVPNHPVSRPASADKPEINCITCHKPHSGNGGRRRFVTEKANQTDLCVRCH